MLVSTFDGFNLESRQILPYKRRDIFRIEAIFYEAIFLSAMTSENCTKPKARRQSLTRSEDEVFGILKKAQVIEYSSDLVSLVLTGKASLP